MSDLDRLGEALSTLRSRAGLTQGEIAKRAGMSYTSVSRYERGVESPQTKNLGRLLDALGATVYDLAEALQREPRQSATGTRGQARASWVEALRQRGIDRDVIFGFAHGALAGEDPQGEADLVASAQEAARLIAETELEERRRTLAEIEADRER